MTVSKMFLNAPLYFILFVCHAKDCDIEIPLDLHLRDYPSVMGVVG